MILTDAVSLAISGCQSLVAEHEPFYSQFHTLPPDFRSIHYNPWITLTPCACMSQGPAVVWRDFFPLSGNCIYHQLVKLNSFQELFLKDILDLLRHIFNLPQTVLLLLEQSHFDGLVLRGSFLHFFNSYLMDFHGRLSRHSWSPWR